MSPVHLAFIDLICNVFALFEMALTNFLQLDECAASHHADISVVRNLPRIRGMLALAQLP